MAKSAYDGGSEDILSLLNGDRLSFHLLMLSLMAGTVTIFYLRFKTKKWPRLNGFIPFVMYFIAFGYGLSFMAFIGCGLYDAVCPVTIVEIIRPKIDAKFLIIGGLAMFQYGISGLVHTIKSAIVASQPGDE